MSVLFLYFNLEGNGYTYSAFRFVLSDPESSEHVVAWGNKRSQYRYCGVSQPGFGEVHQTGRVIADKSMEDKRLVDSKSCLQQPEVVLHLLHLSVSFPFTNMYFFSSRKTIISVPTSG